MSLAAFLAAVLTALATAGVVSAQIKSLDDLDAAGIGKGYKAPKMPELSPAGGGCRLTLAEAKTKLRLQTLSDSAAFKVIHSTYYADMSREDLAARLCYTLPPQFKPAELGMVDKWRYESCLNDAAKAPTERGVSVGINLCHRRFKQME